MAEINTTIITGGTIVDGGRTFAGYLHIAGPDIVAVQPGNAPQQLLEQAGRVIDATGCLVMPGAIDDHVHFREPGLTHKADIASESLAAVAGGVTSYLDMPNVSPATTSLEAWQAKMQRASQVSLANYGFWVGATAQNVPLLATLDYTRVPGIKVFLGSSTGGMLLNDAALLRQVFAIPGALVAVHSEDEDIISANRERLLASRGADGDLPLELHPVLRSEQACWQSTSRAVELARELGTRLHVLHVTTARELALFGAGPLLGKRITAEACPAHLLFADADYARLGTRIKCNPAVKTAADRDALRAAVAQGRIDVIGTDHAPHLLAEKQGGCLRAASGMPMVQFSLAAMLELFDPALVAQKMAQAPAQLLGIADRGRLLAGYKADVAVVRPEPDGYTLTDADVLSRCGWTPLAGATLHHRVTHTLVNGHLAWCNGKASAQPHGQALRFAASGGTTSGDLTD